MPGWTDRAWSLRGTGNPHLLMFNMCATGHMCITLNPEMTQKRHKKGQHRAEVRWDLQAISVSMMFQIYTVSLKHAVLRNITPA